MLKIDWRKLEKASVLHRRSLERCFASGAPKPRKGQSLKDWAIDLHAWRKAHRKKTGPKPIPGLEPQGRKNDHLVQEWLRLRNRGLELDIARKRRLLVLREDAEADLVALMTAFREALMGADARLRGRCERREGDDVQREIADEHRAILEELARGAWRPQRHTEAVDDAADGSAAADAAAAGEADPISLGGPIPPPDEG